MERNTETDLGVLIEGDRFYKKGDKNKQVYQHTGAFETAGKGRSLYYYVYCHKIGSNPNYPDKIKSTTEVIFLRHTNNTTDNDK